MTPIYHITHRDNLASIIKQACLWCDRSQSERGGTYVGIAYQHIKERRLRRIVTAEPGGVVADYVPFYFAPRSPMLYALHRGYVEGYSSTQAEVLHLIAYAEVVKAEGLPFVFTDGHAEMAISEFFVDLADLEYRIDWNIMKETYWHDTNADGDRKRRRQAEFLVQRSFPWPLISEIGVINRSALDKVSAILTNASHRPSVAVHRDWYY